MDRNRLKGEDGDQMNAVMSAAGMNFRKLLKWLAGFLILSIFLARLIRIEPRWHIEIMLTGEWVFQNRLITVFCGKIAFRV